MSIGGIYRCINCGRELNEGEFMAVIGAIPATGLSTPLGRADIILEEVGKIFCEICFKEHYERVEKATFEDLWSDIGSR